LIDSSFLSSVRGILGQVDGRADGTAAVVGEQGGTFERALERPISAAFIVVCVVLILFRLRGYLHLPPLSRMVHV